MTIVVPTRDRATLLPECLAGLARQRTSARFEVVVVDNGSADATADVVRRAARADARFRLLQEPVAGLSRAKNAGLAAAEGELVLFIDDDVLVPDTWVETYAAFLRTPHAAQALAGGPVLPVAHDLAPWPRWVGDSTADLPRLYHGSSPRPLGGFEWLWGANMGARRELLASLGGFDESVGNVAQQRGTFEDVELVQLHTSRGGACWYLPDAVVYHRTAPAHARPRALAARAFARGANDVLRTRRGGHVEPAMPVPRGRVAASAAAPMLLAAWMASASAFRLTRLPRALRLARRLAWGAGWCIATSTALSAGAGARPLARLADLGRRMALRSTPP